jgi:hypothetical protein
MQRLAAFSSVLFLISYYNTNKFNNCALSVEIKLEVLDLKVHPVIVLFSPKTYKTVLVKMSINCLYSGRAKRAVLEVSFSKFLSDLDRSQHPKSVN